ncbi:MAG: ATP-binding cassette domain-containing protein [Clostridiales bacterium]|nr:ATP-binding cassette domain-containing protein [Clostridiales bacterium]
MKLNNLTKKYDKIIFRNINYDFKENNIYSIFGKNGVGKTTLLSIIANQLMPDEGIVESFEDNIMFISEDIIPFSFLTGKEFVVETLKMKNIDITEDLVIKTFKKFSMLEAKDKLIVNYSKGMKYKLILILIVIINPKILIMDEPFADIDILTIQIVKEFFDNYKKNKIVIFSTHLISIASKLSDKILYLSENNLIELGVNKKNENEFEKILLKLMKEEYKL